LRGAGGDEAIQIAPLRDLPLQPSLDLVQAFTAGEAIMSGEMGIFRTMVGIENLTNRGTVEYVPDVMVDTGSELSWIPAPVLEGLGIPREKQRLFRLADGSKAQRDTGYAFVHVSGAETPDEVVFAEPGDSVLLGARSIEGLNLRIDLASKRLVNAGPFWAAAMA
jgi:predicted aspartyl protease